MTQQIINVGAVANDGTGESLRSAFQAVNDNFSNVWAQGPVDSQVVISNNVISTNVTNRNLVLQANGIGVITVASSVVPGIDSVWDLGAANAQYDSVYARYYYGDASNMTGLPQPTDLEAVNTDILPIATQAFNIGSQTQQWQKIYTSGIVAGNNSVITINVGNLHIPGGTNGYVLQTDGAGNLSWTAQTGGGGNGSPGGANTQIQFNDAGAFGGQADFTFNKTSNVMTVPGNIIPNANAAQSLGNVSHQWKDLWVSNNTIYINSVPLTLSAGNVLSIGGEPLVTVNANSVANIGNFVFNGNRLENNNGSSFDNGSLVNGATALLSLPANGNTNPVVVYNSYGNIVLQAGANSDVTAQWNFNNNGTLSTQGNISANSVSLSGELIFANASGAVGEVGYGFSGPAINAYTGKSVTIRSNDQAYSWRFGTAGNLTLPDGSVLESGVLYGNVSAALGNSTGDIKVYAQNSGVGIQTYDGTNTKTWFYDRNGNLTLPGNTFAVNYANGTPVSLGNGGGISTGNITFSGDNIGSTNDIVNIVASNQVAITTSSLTSISAPCYIGLPDEFVADTEFNDDITAVQVGWTVVVDSVEYTVTYIDPAPPANQYRITAAGATFVSLTEYTFTNPVPVPHSWTVDQYGTLTTPAGGTISQINNDFVIEVGGTDIIALRTDGGDLIFDAAGNININGPINSTTGVAALNLTGGVAYLTSSDNDTTALNMNATGVQLYAGVNVGVTAGVLIPGLETNYTDSRTALEEMFDLNSGEVGYPWGITLPVSQITYNELILLAPDTFPNQAACTVQAYDTQNNWELWQDTIAQSNVTITSNELDWVFNSDGSTVYPVLSTPRGDSTGGNITGYTLRIGDGQQEAVISTPNGNNDNPTSQRLVINPGKGQDGTPGEGGDIYLWAGRGGSGDDANAISGGSGGDIKIRGGQGGGTNGYGGYIRMEAGDGASGGGYGGYIDITGGAGGTGQMGGYVRILGGQGDLNGGDANITGGTSISGTGGVVNIAGGVSGLGLADYGNVNISAGASTWTFDNAGNLTTSSNLIVGPSPAGGSSILQYDSALQVVGEGANAIMVMGWAANTNAPDSIAVVGFNTPYTNGASNVQIAVGNNATTVNYWTFDNTGNLTLPGGGIVYGNPYTPSGAPGNTITLQPAGSGTITDQRLLVYPTAGDGDHIHLTSGNLYQTELFLGSDNLYVKLSASGNIVVNANDGTGNTAQWNFGTDGTTIFPGNITGSGASPAPSISGFDSINSVTVSASGNVTGGNIITAGTVSVYSDTLPSWTQAALWVDGGITTGQLLTKDSLKAWSAPSVNTAANVAEFATINTNSSYPNEYPYIKLRRNYDLSDAQNDNYIGGITFAWDRSSVNRVISEIKSKVTGGFSTAAGSLEFYTSTGSTRVLALTINESQNIIATGNITGNYILGNGSQLTNLPAPTVAQDITSVGNMSLMTYDGNIKYVNYATVEPATGSINSSGNISATGNVIGNYFVGNGSALTSVATQVTGSWTLTTGTNTVSFTIPTSGTYSIWVNGNIPNGIATYTATIVLTNNNVPVLGSSYAWYYANGNALVWTSIPDQIVGTNNTISNAAPAVSNTNVFTFGIDNNSGSSQVVNYGWTKIG